MIKFKGKTFPDRLALWVYIYYNGIENFNTKLFLHSNYYYIRAALEDRFNRPFSFKEIQTIIQDKTWQNQDTPSQTQDLSTKAGVQSSLHSAE